MPDIDIAKLIAAAGIKQTPGVDDCYILQLDQIEHVAALVLEEAARTLDADENMNDEWGPQVKFMAIQKLRTIAEGLKP